MIRVLTIDTDVLLNKEIRKYEDQSTTGNRDEVWNKIYEEHPELRGKITVDINLFNALKIFLVETLKLNPNAKLGIGERHDSILNLLESDMSSSNRLSITNIDNHHDICYSSKHIDLLAKGETNETNWLGYLYCQGLLEDYTWVNRPHSQVKSAISLEVTYKVKSIKKFLKHPVGNWGYIHICKSPNWLPEEYDYLFKELVAIMEQDRESLVLDTKPYIKDGVGKVFINNNRPRLGDNNLHINVKIE